MRPWGFFERFTLNQTSTVKLLHVAKGKRLSLQYHNKREEFWEVVIGKVAVTVDSTVTTLKRGQRTRIPIRATHRLEGIEDSIVLELAFGDFDENDIVRVEDDFGRTFPSGRKEELNPISIGYNSDSKAETDLTQEKYLKFAELIRACRRNEDVDKRIEMLHVINSMLPKSQRLTIPSLITGHYVDMALSRIEVVLATVHPA